MRRHWLLMGVALLSSGLALAAIACGDDDGGDGGYPTATTEPAGEATATTAPSAGGEPVDVTINEVDGSGVTGSATLTPKPDGGFAVDVTVDGNLEEGTHASHIHQGSTCASPTAPVAVPLSDVEADASGAGTATTNIADTPLSDFQDGNSYVAVHALDGAVVGCADIPAAS